MSDLLFQSVAELAAAVRERRISAVELFERHLEQLHRHNPALRAVVTHDAAAARRRAAEADQALARGEPTGPLHGVPVTVKDSFATAGMRTTASFRRLADHVPREDATVVARLRAAGAIVWGKTNMPELAMDFQSQSPLFGRASNPHDLSRTPGGSSGGAAAAVAAGLTSFEVGSDIGGSLRLPAHFCGVFSLKPTEHRVPLTGHIPEPPGAPRAVRHMGCAGPIARNVADLRLLLALLAGPDGREWEVPPIPLPPPRPRALADLRLAWTDTFGPLRAAEEVRAPLAALVAGLAARGAAVSRAAPEELDVAAAWTTWGELLGAEVAGPMPPPIRLLMQARFLAMRDPLGAAIARGAWAGVGGHATILTRRDAMIGALERFLSGVDAWLCPVSAVPAITHTKPGARIVVDGAPRPYMQALGGFTTVFNLTGHPVVVVPIGRTAAGLPVGVQIVGRRWDDAALLDVAEAIAGLGGGAPRPPGY